ncbi:methionine--tRNA ligase [Bacillota bacterium LX-D]|nr:methionine--tRNA ligase [Bacillota bacterium LX-D]
MEKKTYYITTPIYYPSDKLHIGHALTTTMADTLARFKRMQGYDVFFLTGSDEHGQKIERKAKEAGVTPLAYVDKIVATFQNLWAKLGISNDDFIRTSEERHQKVVQELFKKIYDQGDIYKSEYEGWYCTPCETFFTDRQLVEGKCPDCGRPVEVLKEESYFFKMSKYADRLLEYIETHPEFIQPVTRRNEMISFIKQGLADLCISRTTFDWGIPVPIDEKHVIYVWFDALTNYISALGYGSGDPKFEKYWPSAVHLVGKDIMRFHTIIWPIILMAAGIKLPNAVFGHGWLLVDGSKMSKSKGNVIDPMALIAKYGADTIRYFLLREMPYGADGYYSEDALILRTNTDLANDYGNLLSRTTSMLNKFCAGRIPVPGDDSPEDAELKRIAAELPEKVAQALNKFEFGAALASIWELINKGNKYIEENTPWALAKDPAKEERLYTVMYNLAEVIRISTVLLTPFLPHTPEKVWSQLGLTEHTEAQTWESILSWGKMPTGIKINRGEPIFPRIEEEKDTKPEMKKVEEKQAVTPLKTQPKTDPQIEEEGANLISIDDFAKVELRVAEVLEAKKVEKADKLLELQVALGEEKRTVVAGIALHYTPEELVGKKIIMVTNLKPAKLRGITSYGMLLAASVEGKLSVLTLDRDVVPSGAKVK